MDRIGRYRIVRELGRGAMGVVYQAIDPTIGRPLAIKTIRLREVDDPSQRARLRERLFREARAAGVLSHPGIVTIYDMKEEEGLAYIAMQFVNGPTLDDLMARDSPLKQEEIFRVLRQTAAALDFAHGKGIVHRDIKPANIMIDEDGSVKIADFGIAKAGASGNLTVSGTILGTPNYMSPEQVQGTNIDGRSDQFSLAVVAYEMLTGERPFSGEHLGTVVYKIVAEQPVPPDRLNPSLGPEITVVLGKALSKNADERYVSCTEFVNALVAACSRVDGWRGLARGSSEALPTAAAVDRPAASVPMRTEGITRARSDRSRSPKQRSLFLPALGAFLLVLGGLALIAWQTGAFPSNKAAAAPKTSTSAAAPKAEPNPAPDDTESQPPQPSASERSLSEPAPSEPAAPRAAPPVQKRLPPHINTAAVPRGADQAVAIPGSALPQDVWVTTNPPGATATLDGNSANSCQTPCLLLGSSGTHSLSLSLTNYQTERRQVRVENERADVPLVTLRPAGGTLMLSSVPSRANIFINDNLLQDLTPAQLNLPPGSYRVAVQFNGGPRKTQQIEIRNGVTNYIRIPLQP